MVTATTEPSAARRCGQGGVDDVEEAGGVLGQLAGQLAPASTADRCFIGTCGPAAWTSVCSPPYVATTAATTAAHAAASVTSSSCAEACTPQPRAASTAGVGGLRTRAVGQRHRRAARREQADDGQAEPAAATDDQGAARPRGEVGHGQSRADFRCR